MSRWYRNIEGIPKKTICEEISFKESYPNEFNELLTIISLGKNSSPDGLKYFLNKCNRFNTINRCWENIIPNEFSDDIIESLILNKHTILIKERQIFFSTIAAVICLYYTQILGKSVVIINKGSFERFKMMYLRLPEHLKYGVNKFNRAKIKFNNGSHIRFFDKYENIGYVPDLLIFDEYDFLNGDCSEFVKSFLPTINARLSCKLLIASYPNKKRKDTGSFQDLTNNDEYCLYNFEILDWLNYELAVKKIKRNKTINDIFNGQD
jgi:hypothetical protein